MDRIEAVRALLGRPMATSKWSSAIAASVRLLAAPAWGDEWQWDQLERLLAETFTTAEPDAIIEGPDPDITLPEARVAVAGWVEDRPSPLHFRTGNVTVCTLAPMRSVPYRVVALLGMDDERFPRSSRADGDDLLLGHEIVGDHDRDAQDRQLLLDAVMAAGDHLIVTYSGRDELTNAEYPPAVPIAELEDTLRETIGAAALESVVTVHPLQSFSADNFMPGALGVPGPWGFDPIQLEGAVAMGERAADAIPAAVEWPVHDDSEPIQLGALVGFLQQPARRFIRTRLGFSIPALGEVPDDALPVDIDALARWSVTNRILTGLTEGYGLDDLAERERAADALPPGDLGIGVLEDARATAAALWAAAVEKGYGPGRVLGLTGAVTVGGAVVEGSVAADPSAGLLILVTPSRLKAKQRLKAFAELVFLCVLKPEISWKALLLGKREYGDGLLAVTIGPIGDSPTTRRQQADLLLAELVDLYDEGMQAPLAMPCETCYAWQRALGKGRASAYNAARSKWETDRFSPECEDDAYRLLFPDLTTTDALVDAGLAGYSARLWSPILPLLRETTI
jgi:exodeoxyribonuclease V gamma subunit